MWCYSWQDYFLPRRLLAWVNAIEKASAIQPASLVGAVPKGSPVMQVVVANNAMSWSKQPEISGKCTSISAVSHYLAAFADLHVRSIAAREYNGFLAHARIARSANLDGQLTGTIGHAIELAGRHSRQLVALVRNKTVMERFPGVDLLQQDISLELRSETLYYNIRI